MVKSSTSRFFSYLNDNSEYSFVQNPVPVFYVLYAYHNRMRLFLDTDKVQDFDLIPSYVNREFYYELKSYSEKEILKNLDYFQGIINSFEWYGGVDYEEIVELLMQILSNSNGKFANCRYSDDFIHVVAELLFSINDDMSINDICSVGGSMYLMQNAYGREWFETPFTTYALDKECYLITGVRLNLHRMMEPELCNSDHNHYAGTDFNDSKIIYCSPATWSPQLINDIISKILVNSEEVGAVLHLPAEFCYAPKYENARKLIIDSNCLNKVVYLPDNICDNLKQSSVLVSLEKTEANEDPSFVTFIDARAYVSEKGEFLGSELGDDIYRYSSITSSGRPNTLASFIQVPFEEISNSEKCRFYPLSYMARTHTDSDSVAHFALSSFFSISEGEDNYTETKGYVILDKHFCKSNAYLFQQGDVAESTILEGYLKYCGKSIVISVDNQRFELALVPADIVFYTKPSSIVLSFNGPLSTNADLNYFAHSILANEEYASRLLVEFSNKPAHEVCKNVRLSFLYDNEDRHEYVEGLRREFIRRTISEDAVQQTTSDLKHMLSITFSTIFDKIKYLKESGLSDTSIADLVKIEHNVNYIGRQIDSYENDFLISNKKEVLVNKLIADYIDVWNALGREGFKVEFFSNLDDSVSADLDKNQIYIMLDTILENARRHGFGKIKRDGNLVQIHLKPANIDGKEYFSLVIQNNGNRLTSDFTRDCYVTKGSYAGKYGRSGKGGYHVNRIVQQHRGYLDVYSNEVWGAIVEVCIPIK